ncbi:MAG: hypothetical protein QOD07_215 [Frankiaceae bacterium]|jgi:hypothetical protein|nr:hypothetical protein [Frankiaceae bacterium]
MTFSCPSCGDEVRTRVLADPVTLVVVGHCEQHGVQEVSRVYVGELSGEPFEVQDEVSTYPDAAPAATPVPVTAIRTSSAYRPGECCGRRLGEWSWCQLPANHQEPHAA